MKYVVTAINRLTGEREAISRPHEKFRAETLKRRYIQRYVDVHDRPYISLQVVADEREQLVAVKPVCEILGVAYQSQQEKLKEHPIFGSTITLSVTVGADGKDREMLCIPLQFFPGWLFSINPDNVKEEARERLIKYQLECNRVLFKYFFSRVDFSRKKEKAVAMAKETCDEKLEQLRIAKSELKVAENELSKAMAMTFEDWQADRQQLTIPGFE